GEDPAVPALRRHLPRQAGLAVPPEPRRAALGHERHPQLVQVGQQTIESRCRSIAAPSGTWRVLRGSPSLRRKRRRRCASSGGCSTTSTASLAWTLAPSSRSPSRESDERRARNAPLSALDGVPIAIKDLFCQRGVETTAGSRILAGYVPPYDATVVRKLREGGAVLVGKLNMDEFAMGSSTENSAFGPTRNPWDLSRTPGGSSGGSAAAVAAKMVPGTL